VIRVNSPLNFRQCDVFGLFHSKAELASDPVVRKLIAEQTVEWTEMIERHRKESLKVLQQQVEDQKEVLKALLVTTQATQMKQLEAKHER